jgi:GNAT superfamily N-acetyltransferase
LDQPATNVMTLRSNLEIEEIPLGDRRLRAFLEFPWQLYRRHPHWTPPLRAEYTGSRILGINGLLTRRHHYHRNTEVTHFIVTERGRTIGRITAAVNHRFNAHYQARIGFFGFFEVIDDYGAARTLLDGARDWLRKRGMTLMRGPGEYSCATHERQGILVSGYEYPPTFDLTHNPPYYADFLERYGLMKAKDYLAYQLDVQSPEPEPLAQLAQHLSRRGRIQTRPIDMRDLDNEVRLVVDIYNEAWAQNWGFLPLSEEDGQMIADGLRSIADPGLVRFAFIHGEPAAILGVFPDPYTLIRPGWRWYGDGDAVRLLRLLAGKRRIRRTRLLLLGIRPDYRGQGVDALLYHEIKEYAMRRGYRTCEASLLLEDNDLVIRVWAGAATSDGVSTTCRSRLHRELHHCIYGWFLAVMLVAGECRMCVNSFTDSGLYLIIVTGGLSEGKGILAVFRL